MTFCKPAISLPWVEHLQARGIAVSVIPGASHFFDNPYEFDLHDVVQQTVTGR